MTEYGATRVGIGLNDWDFAWRLNLARPSPRRPALPAIQIDGFETASRTLHDFIALPAPRQDAASRALQFIREAVFFDVNEASQMAVAERATADGRRTLCHG